MAFVQIRLVYELFHTFDTETLFPKSLGIYGLPSGSVTIVASLWLALPAGAIDPARLHRKPFSKPPTLNNLPGHTRPALPGAREEESVIPLIRNRPTVVFARSKSHSEWPDLWTHGGAGERASFCH